jgi:hypothetical protein
LRVGAVHTTHHVQIAENHQVEQPRRLLSADALHSLSLNLDHKTGDGSDGTIGAFDRWRCDHGLARLRFMPSEVPSWAPDDDEDTRCVFCAVRPAVWAYRISRGSVEMCERCRELFERGDDEQLITLQVEKFERDFDEPVAWTQAEIEAQFAAPLRRMRSAAIEVHRLVKHLDPTEVIEIKRAGYESLEEYTGATAELGPCWPADCARSFPETRWFAQPGDVRWYVRSPWPNIPLPDIFTFIWPFVERGDGLDTEVRLARMREVLTWPEDRALAAANYYR